MFKHWSRTLSMLVGLCAAPAAISAPWIDAEDVYLRNSIQLLADGGHLNGVVNTYPLMWSGIARDLKTINTSALSDAEQFAYGRVRAALNYARRPRVRGVKVHAASEDNAVQPAFGEERHSAAGVSVSRASTGDYTASRIRTTIRTGSNDEKRMVLDGSYLATTLGNWALSLDQMPVWWGPGQDNALVLSTNAKPLQALRVSRLEDSQSAVPVLSWLGNWHATAFLGRTQRAGGVGDNYMGGWRLASRPLPFVELGVGYTGQWGGDGYSNSLAHAADMYLLQSDEAVGNQVGGADIRVSLPAGVGAYAETATNNSDLDNMAILAGIDMQFGEPSVQQHLFVEYSDIPANFYMDDRDPAGYRRWERTIGSSLDQHAESVAVGFHTQDATGTGWRLKLRWSEFGATNHVVTAEYDMQEGDTVERLQADISYQRALGNGLLKLGTQLFSDEFHESGGKQRKDRENTAVVSVSWELRF